MVGKTILHFAAEPQVREAVESLASDYRSADIRKGKADLLLDIEKIALSDGVVDAVICFHVLEHVDDRAALAELHRILSENGILLLMVPLVESWETAYENSRVATPRERLLHFGQADHLRYYGADVNQRIQHAGFAVKTLVAEEPAVGRYGLLRGEKLFICTKRNGSKAEI